MVSRRQEKVSKVIMSSVSTIIQNEISDPRVQGLISVTRVDPAPDLKSARVFLSILGVTDNQKKLCLMAINHANGFIRTRLSQQLSMKTCPALQFHIDENLQNEIATLQIIDEVSRELHLEDEKNNDTLPPNPNNQIESEIKE